MAYHIGPKPGLIRYFFQDGTRPNTKMDTLSFGFITPLENAVILRIDSQSSNDYLEFEIVRPIVKGCVSVFDYNLVFSKVGGCLFAAYNLGMQDITVGDMSVRVNDGSYHVVRFVRTGANCTLQVDDFPIQSSHPEGRQLLVFNTQTLLQIGGKWNNGLKRVDRPFIGVIAGMVFNGLRPLDLAAERNALTQIQGIVNLLFIAF